MVWLFSFKRIRLDGWPNQGTFKKKDYLFTLKFRRQTSQRNSGLPMGCTGFWCPAVDDDVDVIGERAIDCEVNEDVEWEDETFFPEDVEWEDETLFPEDDDDQAKVDDEMRLRVQSHAFSGTVEDGVEAHLVDKGVGSHLSVVLPTIFDILVIPLLRYHHLWSLPQG